MQPPPAPVHPTVLRRAPAPGAAPPLAPAAGPPAVPLAPAPASLAGARLMLAAFGVAVLALSGYLLVERDFAFTLLSTTGLLARGALAAAFLALAAWPHQAAERLRAPRLATPGGLAAAAMVVGALYFIFGLGTAVETANLLQQAQQGTPSQDLVPPISREDLLLSLGLSFLIFTIPTLAWASWAEGHPGERALAWLRLRRSGWRWSVAWSLLAVLVVFWFLVLAGLVSKLVGGGDPSNPRAEAIAANLDIPSALLVAALTGVGEEVFFRGFLQRKVGVIPQAVLFGLAHLNYLQVLEVAVTAVLGYGFGRAVDKTGNLWGAIIGHATFNAVSLILILSKANGWLA